MAKVVSFTDKRVQVVPETTTKGAFLKLVKDTHTYQDGSVLETEWGQTLLSEISLDSITEETKKKWREALGITGIINNVPKIVLLDPIQSITQEGLQEIPIRVYLDD